MREVNGWKDFINLSRWTRNDVMHESYALQEL
jgi:hypothetical protein